ncbi:MAG: hypothetical protein BWX64_02524 [Acidobacteria bacterium ADurb.Bin051]|nr:MAG: hypothetical protein BWX64_02524 [Acidobacteria bacterium ADurb.Bin051]
MSRRLACAVGLVALALGVLACGPARSAPKVVPRPVERGPRWVVQAVWDTAEKRLLLADPGSETLYQIDRTGRIVRRLRHLEGRPLELREPFFAFRVDKRYLVRADPYRYLWLDQALRVRDALPLSWEKAENPEYSDLAYAQMAAGSTRFSASVRSVPRRANG